LRRRVAGRGVQPVRQQVAGELPDQELVVRQVAVQRRDHPVAPRPLAARQVLLVTVAVRVARRVQPPARPLLAIRLGPQQPLDGLAVRRVAARPVVRHERVRLRRRRRQAHQVQRQPPQQGLRRRLAGRRQFLPGQPRAHQGVHRVSARRRFRQRGPGRREEGPVPLVLRARRDPLAQHLHLRGRHRLLRLRRRHQVVGVVRHQPGEQLAGLGPAGHERRFAGLAAAQRGRAVVEPQVGLARLVVLAVAGEAVLGEDGPHVAVERGRGRRQGEAHAQPPAAQKPTQPGKHAVKLGLPPGDLKPPRREFPTADGGLETGRRDSRCRRSLRRVSYRRATDRAARLHHLRTRQQNPPPARNDRGFPRAGREHSGTRRGLQRRRASVLGQRARIAGRVFERAMNVESGGGRSARSRTPSSLQFAARSCAHARSASSPPDSTPSCWSRISLAVAKSGPQRRASSGTRSALVCSGLTSP
jgi:hypothetical protein